MVPSVVLLVGVLQVIFLGFGIYMMKKNPLLDGIGGGMFPFQIKLGNILLPLHLI